MNVLLVEPNYRKKNKRKSKNPRDESLWYPPIGLLKIGRYHEDRGDKVEFICGYDNETVSKQKWDRIYITTLFTFHFKKVVESIKFYLGIVNNDKSKVFVGGIMSTLMQNEIKESTGIAPHVGLLTSSRYLGFTDGINIDQLIPAMHLVSNEYYAINRTFYGYTTRGCKIGCPWCGVPKIEPDFNGYIDIKPYILALREQYGDLPRLKLMDNNILISDRLKEIVDDLVELGYGPGQYSKDFPMTLRSIDFNQGVDATFITQDTLDIFKRLNIKPMRIAFDRYREKDDYLRALKLCYENGFREFSNYMLYNYKDTPRDLYERIKVNIELNQEWRGLAKKENEKKIGKVFSFPMRYAPIYKSETEDNKLRDRVLPYNYDEVDWLQNPVWTKRSIRNIEIMKGATHGAVSTTPELAWRTFGHNYEEFVVLLNFPEVLLRERVKHEKKSYSYNPAKSGSGEFEKFYKTIKEFLLDNQNHKNFFKLIHMNSRKMINDSNLLINLKYADSLQWYLK